VLLHKYLAEDIENATDGYVNSGVLRMWTSQGLIKAGRKAKLPGGPRTFNISAVMKAALMAKLRTCGLSLDTAEYWAQYFYDEMHMEPGYRTREQLQDQVMYYGIKPETGKVYPILLKEIEKSAYGLMETYGPLVIILDIVETVHYAKIAAEQSRTDRERACREAGP